MKFFKSFHPYAIATILLWSIAYVVTRFAMTYYTAMALGFLRYAVASLVLLPVCLIAKLPLPKWRDLPWFVLAGATGFFLYMVGFNIGAATVTAATGTVIVSMAPVFTALLATLIFREKLAARQWVAIGIEFIGILILTVYGAVLSLNTGVWWLLMAGLSLSCYNLLQRKLTRTYSALQATTYSIFAGTALLALFSRGAIQEAVAAPPIQLLYVVVLGVFSSALAYITWSKALEKADNTSQASNYMFFTPLLAGLLGFLLAGEVPDLSTWLGGAFILGGAFLFNYNRAPDIKNTSLR